MHTQWEREWIFFGVKWIKVHVYHKITLKGWNQCMLFACLFSHTYESGEDDMVQNFAKTPVKPHRASSI